MSEQQLYSPVQVGLGCFFGTPFASLLMLGINFKSVEDKRRHKIAFSLAFAILPILIFFLYQMLEQRWYRILIFFISGLMMYIAEEWQGAIYKKHIEGGGERKPALKVMAAILASVFIIFLFSIFFLMIKELL